MKMRAQKQRAVGATKGKRLAPASPEDKWKDVLRTFRRCARLGELGDMVRAPKISDVEIVVCFTDIRGFTNYCNKLQQSSQDNRIQNFLKAYLELYPLAVLSELCRLETDSGTPIAPQLGRVLVPTTYKNLGDGVMLVWEIPPATSNSMQGRVTHAILKLMLTFYRLFVKRFQQLGSVGVDAYSSEVKTLSIGCGVARGHAWKLDFGHSLKVDYAGSIVNLASRLADKARPEGVVCQYEFSHSLFDKLISKKRGKVQLLKGLKGLGTSKVISLGRKDVEALWLKDDVWKEATE